MISILNRKDSKSVRLRYVSICILGDWLVKNNIEFNKIEYKKSMAA